jgi:hypothetical protein
MSPDTENTMRLLIVPTLLLLAASSAQAESMYSKPYALVERGDSSETRYESTLGLSKIDGVSPRNPRKSDPLTPGKHLIRVHFESARGTFRPEVQDVELDMQPCTRYRIVANYVQPTGPDWKPKVYSEPIGECKRKFKL